VMKRIAAPMVGGMISSTVLTLVVIPAVYAAWKERALRSASAIPSAQPTWSDAGPAAHRS
jgi:Cu(I)/Ag(I) efflux system membrane protein CusA/SilA